MLQIYVNIVGRNNAKTMVAYSFSSALKVNANYTFTQVEEPLSRLIPKHKGNISLDYQATPRSFFTINYQFVDKRKDAFFDGTFATTAVLLDSYQLVNAMAKYDVIKTDIVCKQYLKWLWAQRKNFKIGVNVLF
jgi:vitamin B12 transporter